LRADRFRHIVASLSPHRAMPSVAISPMPPDCSARLRSLLYDYQDGLLGSVKGGQSQDKNGTRLCARVVVRYNGGRALVWRRSWAQVTRIFRTPSTSCRDHHHWRCGRSNTRSASQKRSSIVSRIWIASLPYSYSTGNRCGF